jgi:hypothetical protein
VIGWLRRVINSSIGWLVNLILSTPSQIGKPYLEGNLRYRSFGAVAEALFSVSCSSSSFGL